MGRKIILTVLLVLAVISLPLAYYSFQKNPLLREWKKKLPDVPALERKTLETGNRTAGRYSGTAAFIKNRLERKVGPGPGLLLKDRILEGMKKIPGIDFSRLMRSDGGKKEKAAPGEDIPPLPRIHQAPRKEERVMKTDKPAPPVNGKKTLPAVEPPKKEKGKEKPPLKSELFGRPEERKTRITLLPRRRGPEKRAERTATPPPAKADQPAGRNFFMTFDAHDDNSQVDYILSVLRKYEVRAVFFLTGHFIQKYPGDTRKIMREGHLVGNHALTHTYFRSEDQLRFELHETERVFLRATGYTMEKVWHSPFLQHLDPKWEWIIRAAERQGYRHIDVSFDTIDWAREGSAGYRSSEDFMRAFRGMIEKDWRSFRAGGERKGERPGGIVMLMHPGKYRREPLVRALPRIIEHLRASGYRVEDGARLTGIR